MFNYVTLFAKKRPREFLLAYKKESYTPANPPSASSAPPAKRPRITREEDTPPSPGRVRSTIIFTQKYKYGSTIHKYSISFMYGI
jgi:hypothetical protein